jgi:hypothetical protein
LKGIGELRDSSCDSLGESLGDCLDDCRIHDPSDALFRAGLVSRVSVSNGVDCFKGDPCCDVGALTVEGDLPRGEFGRLNGDGRKVEGILEGDVGFD